MICNLNIVFSSCNLYIQDVNFGSEITNTTEIRTYLNALKSLVNFGDRIINMDNVLYIEIKEIENG